MLTIFGAAGSGSVPIEAMLTLHGIPYEVIEAVTGRTKRRASGSRRSIRCAKSRRWCCRPARS